MSFPGNYLGIRIETGIDIGAVRHLRIAGMPSIAEHHPTLK
jgi:hypothetical protein